MSSTAAKLQSTNTPAFGSNNKIASALRSNKSWNMDGLSLKDHSAALGLSSRFREPVEALFMGSRNDLFGACPAPTHSAPPLPTDVGETSQETKCHECLLLHGP